MDSFFYNSSGLDSAYINLGALCTKCLLLLIWATVNWGGVHARHQRLLLVFFFNRFLFFDFSFFFIEIFTLGRETVHFNSEVTKRALESFPVIHIIKQLETIGLHKRRIHIWKLLRNCFPQEVDCVLLIGWVRVRVAILAFDRCLDLRLFGELDHLLEDLTLQLEAWEVTAVGHN